MAAAGPTDVERVLALVVGWEVTSFPSRVPERVEAVFGPERGAVLAARAAAILDDLGGIPPDWARHDLIQASRHAAAEVMARHVGLGPLAGDVLFWVYSFGYR